MIDIITKILFAIILCLCWSIVVIFMYREWHLPFWLMFTLSVLGGLVIGNYILVWRQS